MAETAQRSSLTITAKDRESFFVGECEVRINSARSGKASVTVTAPRHVKILRGVVKRRDEIAETEKKGGGK